MENLLQDKPNIIIFCNDTSLNNKEIPFFQILVYIYSSAASNPIILLIPVISNT